MRLGKHVRRNWITRLLPMFLFRNSTFSLESLNVIFRLYNDKYSVKKVKKIAVQNFLVSIWNF